ncbi:uncharacterized protein AMSG_05208 [Thecamonas trahens ATCC 50062]|uniref:Uncharacterized protein n=1 Tax=Thecamonas trahens ATCC 50062 TaxID=461836 RepID=A0A0L0DAV9_THETB|nr:hypothetical protein AMSG_05208 [Thecamonas trahens ATCC 50062]KNC49221.1 hypothetical protein AMSG_05208 [Thecamonas trahens ATCC 50062]|eukprot:XP_013757940.1 hypothetical protein AMSG_05208 [Thecamonas trahens ATCC 50062]
MSTAFRSMSNPHVHLHTPPPFVAGYPMVPAAPTATPEQGGDGVRTFAGNGPKRKKKKSKREAMPAAVHSSDVGTLRSALRSEVRIRRELQSKMVEVQAKIARLWDSLPVDVHASFEASATQYDLGLKNACTFIAAAVGIQFLVNGIVPTAQAWDLLLRLGGQAYTLGPTRAASLTEALPSVLRVLNVAPTQLALYPDWRTFLYDITPGYPPPLLEALIGPHSALLESKYDLKAALMPDLMHLMPPLALILTGHNETYSVLVSADLKVHFRDSHVTSQHDFGDLHMFFAWLEANENILEPGDTPDDDESEPDDEMIMHLGLHNQVAVHLLLPQHAT